MMRTLRWPSPILFALVMGLGLGSAHAATPNEASSLKRFEDGKKAFEAKDYKGALDAFNDSLQLQPSPNTRLYIARCLRSLNKPASAFTAYRLAAREASDRLNATGEKRYKATRETAVSESAEIEAQVPRLTLAVPSDAPDGTVVKLDEVEVPKAAWGVAVETDPGDHSVAASGPRRQPFTAKVHLNPGEQLRVDVKIPKLPTGTIALVLKTRPSGMQIAIDNTPLDAGDWERIREVDAAVHHITASAPGYVDFAWDGEVKDGGRQEIPITLEAQSLDAMGGKHGTPKWLFFGVAGLSAASVGVASYLAVRAKSIANTEIAKDEFLRSPDEQTKVRSYSTDANILFIASAALAAGAGVLFFTTDWKSHDAEPQVGRFVGPWVSPSGAGMTAAGRF